MYDVSKQWEGIVGAMAVGLKYNWEPRDLILWMTHASGTFSGDNPIDHLEDGDFIVKVENAISVEW